jgi:RNA polymerase sigma factor (TIGR02999 family)
MASTDVENQMTRCIDATGVGSRDELRRMVDLLYEQVRRMTAAEMRRAFPQPIESLTIQPTAIANDAILRVLEQRRAVTNPDQFFALATRFVRRLISDYRRARMAQKRGRGKRGAPIEEAGDVAETATPPPNDDDSDPILRALDKFQELYPRKAEVATLHVICDHPLPKVAEMLDVSLATAQRDWAFAKAWLAGELKSERRSQPLPPTREHP